MQTAIYAVLHFLVDGLSAFVLYTRIASHGVVLAEFLLYNAAAFALQLLFGTVLDLLRTRADSGNEKRFSVPFLVTGAGLAVLLLGAFTHPVILGIGNALFHVGGGADTILKDRSKHLKARALGIFVAPGALGLFLGKALGVKTEGAFFGLLIAGAAVLFAGLLVLLFFVQKKARAYARSDAAMEAEAALSEREKEFRHGPQKPLTGLAVVAIAFLILVVALRSLTGFAVSFSWNNTFLMGLLATLAIVLGKVAGGFFAAKVSFNAAILFSLLPAAFLFWFKDVQVFGIAALFFFNMTMPVSLYFLANRLRDLPGTAFGLLSFSLFLGFLPFFLNWQLPFAERFGTVASLASFVLLFATLLLFIREHKNEEAKKAVQAAAEEEAGE